MAAVPLGSGAGRRDGEQRKEASRRARLATGRELIAVLGAILAVAAVAIAVTNTGAENRVVSGISNGTTIAIFVGVGLFAWRREPGNAFGRLLVIAGFGWFIVSLGSADSSVLYSVGRVAAWVEEVLLIYLFLSYPASRPRSRAARAVVTTAVLTVLVLYLPTALVVDAYPTPSPYAVCSGECPPNALQLTSTQPAFVDDLVRPAREVVAFGVFLATALILAGRLLASTPIGRRTLVPVLLAAMFSVFAAAVYLAARGAGAGDLTLAALEVVRGIATPLAGVGFLVSLVIWQLYEARALERMALSSATTGPPGRLEGVLGDALEDPSLELRFGASGDMARCSGPTRPRSRNGARPLRRRDRRCGASMRSGPRGTSSAGPGRRNLGCDGHRARAAELDAQRLTSRRRGLTTPARDGGRCGAAPYRARPSRRSSAAAGDDACPARAHRGGSATRLRLQAPSACIELGPGIDAVIDDVAPWREVFTRRCLRTPVLPRRCAAWPLERR